jgi:protocatechuate 3,4-dioxygenase alpha subunit
VPEARRPTLIARRTELGGATVYTLDLVLQGQGETAFFNLGG